MRPTLSTKRRTTRPHTASPSGEPSPAPPALPHNRGRAALGTATGQGPAGQQEIVRGTISTRRPRPADRCLPCHAAVCARPHRAGHRPAQTRWFAGQAKRGKPGLAGHPQRGGQAGPTATQTAALATRAEPPRSRGQFPCGRQELRHAVQARSLAWEGLEGAARPSMPMHRIGRGRRRRGAQPPGRPHANLGATAGSEEFA